MKRIISLLLALLLILPAACCAAAEDTVFTTSYYTLTLPRDWDADYEDAGVEDEGVEYLGMFGSLEDEGLVVIAYLVYYETLKDFSMWNADASELEEYAQAMLEDFEDDSPRLLDVMTAGNIPFVLLFAVDEDGDYVYAETMTNGYAIEFFVYMADEYGDTLPMTDEQIERFKTVLATFQPVA